MTNESVVERGAVGTCPDCGGETLAGDKYCENCGADLLLLTGGSPDGTTVPVPAGGCVSCGAGEIDQDGFCTVCGFAQPAARDRVELDLAGVAGVSDRGLRHHRNEDAMALRVTADLAGSGQSQHIVAVVCDGVSTSDRPDKAAKAAADTAADLLLKAAREGDDLEAATEDAVDASLAAVIDLYATIGIGNAPACTYVSAVVTGDAVTVGWVGDSRAYWLAAATQDAEESDADESDADESHTDESDAETAVSFCITVDDSWAQRMVASGQITEAEAAADPRSHALVAWLGADAGTVTPHVRTIRPGRPGAIVVCSDGLWNYLSDADKLASAALPNAMEAPFTAATELTALAIERGGHDNVTVVVVPFPHHGPPVSTPSTTRSTTS